jgi:FkbM family methyltransferase
MMSRFIETGKNFWRYLRKHHSSRKWDLLQAYATLSLYYILGQTDRNTASVLGLTFHFTDFDLFYHLFEEVFLNQQYEFDFTTNHPHIIDAGANIGLTTLYYKFLYPASTIICFEPDRASFALLQKNIEGNGIKGVELHQAALSNATGKLTLHVRRDIEGGDIGASVSQSYRSQYHDLSLIDDEIVKAVKLSTYLKKQPIDLLKMDIEGAESLVLPEIADYLPKIPALIMEFHQLPENPLSNVLQLFEQAGHWYTIHNWSQNPTEWRIANCIIHTRRP